MPTTPSPDINGKKTSQSLYLTMPKIWISDSVRTHTNPHPTHSSLCAKQHKAFPQPHLGHVVLVGTVEAPHVPWSKHAALLELGLLLRTSEAVWIIIWGTTWEKNNPQTKSIRWQHFQVSQKTEDVFCLEESKSITQLLLVLLKTAVSIFLSTPSCQYLTAPATKNFHSFFQRILIWFKNKKTWPLSQQYFSIIIDRHRWSLKQHKNRIIYISEVLQCFPV